MTTWTLQDLTPPTPEEEEAWHKMSQEQRQQEEANTDNQPKSFWNHRVVRMPDDGFGNEWFEVQEVYYNRKGEPCGYCASYVGGETLEELQTQIDRHSKALALPILNSSTDFNNKWEDDYEKEY
jgi:hypothetical protein